MLSLLLINTACNNCPLTQGCGQGSVINNRAAGRTVPLLIMNFLLLIILGVGLKMPMILILRTLRASLDWRNY